jgi:uncharacterized protein involved in response to NO
MIDTSKPGAALWRLGFRPFYLAASLFAALSVPLWALQFAGWLPRAVVPGSLWHAHEMLFGFALAVIVGFLFTAGRNWSNQPTPSGSLLAALVAWWVGARLLAFTPYLLLAGVVSASFPLVAAVALAVPFFAARNRRNYFFVALLAGLGAADLAFALAITGHITLSPAVAIRVGLDLVLFIMAVMAGRVVPMFTNNAIPGARASRHALIERVALGSLLVLPLLDLLPDVPAPLFVTLLGLAASAHALRWWRWQPWTTGRTPLVWVLHAAYAWVPVHLLLRVAAALGWVAPSLAVHALTVGALGGLVIGMITRTARGHTGRPLQAGRREVTAYLLVAAAALARVAGPVWWPVQHAVLAAAGLWAAAFALYAVAYWPVLSRPRLDGKPG